MVYGIHICFVYVYIKTHTYVKECKNARNTIYLDFRKISLDLVEKTNTVAAGWSGNSGQQGPNSAAQWMNIN